MSERIKTAGVEWDVFICHASEDKDAIARPLAEALKAAGLDVWYDEFTLTLGDSLRRSIDYGLAHSRYGVVILSVCFFDKEWPSRELDGLAAKEVNGAKCILPIWHNVDRSQVAHFSPTLADRIAISTSRDIHDVVHEIMRVVQPQQETQIQKLKSEVAQLPPGPIVPGKVESLPFNEVNQMILSGQIRTQAELAYILHRSNVSKKEGDILIGLFEITLEKQDD